MSMMLPPEAPPGMPLPPGGQGTPPPPMDALSGMGVPGDEGIQGLLAALQGGGGGPPGMGGPPGPPAPGDELASEPEPGMSSIEHIQQAMKHLMMAMAGEEDEERGHGITKGMGALQGILAGEQKRNSQLSQLGG